MKKPVALIIMDGFGESKNTDGNAIVSSNTPNLDKIKNEYPNTLIQASGLDVGLPEGQMGNSEVGHTNIGAGRIVYQDLTRVSKAIEDGDFFTVVYGESGIILDSAAEGLVGYGGVCSDSFLCGSLSGCLFLCTAAGALCQFC